MITIEEFERQLIRLGYDGKLSRNVISSWISNKDKKVQAFLHWVMSLDQSNNVVQTQKYIESNETTIQDKELLLKIQAMEKKSLIFSKMVSVYNKRLEREIEPSCRKHLQKVQSMFELLGNQIEYYKNQCIVIEELLRTLDLKIAEPNDFSGFLTIYMANEQRLGHDNLELGNFQKINQDWASMSRINIEECERKNPQQIFQQLSEMTYRRMVFKFEEKSLQAQLSKLTEFVQDPENCPPEQNNDAKPQSIDNDRIEELLAKLRKCCTEETRRFKTQWTYDHKLLECSSITNENAASSLYLDAINTERAKLKLILEVLKGEMTGLSTVLEVLRNLQGVTLPETQQLRSVFEYGEFEYQASTEQEVSAKSMQQTMKAVSDRLETMTTQVNSVWGMYRKCMFRLAALRHLTNDVDRAVYAASLETDEIRGKFSNIRDKLSKSGTSDDAFALYKRDAFVKYYQALKVQMTNGV